LTPLPALKGSRGNYAMKQEKAAKDREKTARGLLSSGFFCSFCSLCFAFRFLPTILTPGKIIVVGLKIAVI